jgi:hypothetical protein
MGLCYESGTTLVDVRLVLLQRNPIRTRRLESHTSTTRRSQADLRPVRTQEHSQRTRGYMTVLPSDFATAYTGAAAVRGHAADVGQRSRAVGAVLYAMGTSIPEQCRRTLRVRRAAQFRTPSRANAWCIMTANTRRNGTRITRCAASMSSTITARAPG